MLASRLNLSWEVTQVVDPDAAAAFAARSVGLEQLSVAYVVDAAHFLARATGKSSWTWPYLKSLSLKSQLRWDTTQSTEKINGLLYLAGVTAQRMPKLQTLTLWNGIKWISIYQRDEGCANITWRGTWDIEFAPRMLAAWRTVAAENREVLRIAKQRVHNIIRSHGDAIQFLDLPCQVVTPASLRQIQREHEGMD